MVIVAGTYGQFCNQLLRLGHHLAHGLEHGYVVNCADFGYHALFPNLGEHPLVSDRVVLPGWLTKWSSRPFARLPIRLWAHERGISVLDRPLHRAAADHEFTEKAVRRVVVATHWDFRDFEVFNRQHATLKHLFAFPKTVEQQAEVLLQQATSRRDVIVGVHLRRGDYAHWEGGRYCYDDTVYTRLMARVATFFPDRAVTFLLCSNEPVDPAAFAEFRVVISRQSAPVDLSALSCCNLLLGPPSTFTHWASFIGQVPLYHVQRADVEVYRRDFIVSRG